MSTYKKTDKQDAQIERVSLDKLIPYARNARTHSDAQVSQIAASIREFGFCNPVLIDKDGGIIAGHGRVLAAQKLGLKEIPTITLGHLSETQRRAYILADNKLALNAGWDQEMLKVEFESLKDDGFDLTLAGFDDVELAGLLAPEPTDADAEPQIDKADELREKWGVVTGQLWRLGEHRILCGDSTRAEDIAKVLLEGEKPLVFSDPPYGISVVGGGGPVKFGKVGGCGIVNSRTYAHVENDDSTDAAKKFIESCRGIGLSDFIVWGGNYFTDFLPPSRCWLVWDKENTGNFADAELAWTSFPKSVKMYRWMWNGLARKGARSTEGISRVHPTQKPVGLHVEILKDFPEHKIVFDGFLGSGTTLLACEKETRKFRGIEISPAYVAVAIQRWADATGQTPVMMQGA